MDGVFTSVKRNVAFLTWYVKGVPFANRRYTKEVKELDLGAETLRIKLCSVAPLPPAPTPHHWGNCPTSFLKTSLKIDIDLGLIPGRPINKAGLR